jgi:hypothetical protein
LPKDTRIRITIANIASKQATTQPRPQERAAPDHHHHHHHPAPPRKSTNSTPERGRFDTCFEQFRKKEHTERERKLLLLKKKTKKRNLS